MNRARRDGQVAVIHSPGHGAGWYSWHHLEELVFDPCIVAWIEAGELDKIETYMTLKYTDVYLGDLKNLTVAWIPEGSKFRIDEYDGYETLQLESTQQWMTA